MSIVPQDVLRRWCALGAQGVTVVVAYGKRQLGATGHTRVGWSVLAYRDADKHDQVTPIFPVNGLDHAIDKIEREATRRGWVDDGTLRAWRPRKRLKF